VSEAVANRTVPSGPGVLRHEGLASVLALPIVLGDRGIELGDEVGFPVRHVDVLAARRQFRQIDRDHGLPRAQVLVELHGIGRFRDRVDLERNQTDVEVVEVLRHRRVRLLTEQRHVGQRLERGDVDAEDTAKQDEMVLRPRAGDRDHQVEVEPIGDGPVVAHDGMRLARQQRVGPVPGRIELEVGGVARQHHRASERRPLLFEPRGRHDQQIAGAHELRFGLDDGRLDALEVLPLVHAVVKDGPLPALTGGQREVGPGGNHHEAHGRGDVVGVPQATERGQERGAGIAGNVLAVDIGHAGRAKLDFEDILGQLANPGRVSGPSKP
jgi:hypothetical protein